MAYPSPAELEQKRRDFIETLRKQGIDGETLKAAAAALDAPPTAIEVEPAAAILPATPATMRAAIAHTFVVATSTVPSGGADEIVVADDNERAALLSNSRIVMIGGQNRLQLTDESRGDLLTRVQTSEEFRSLVRTAAAVDGENFKKITNDPVALPAAWLRSFLYGVHGDLRAAPPTELRAAVDALERLQFAKLPTVTLPTIAEARRLLEWSELLEPLRMLIGSTGGWEGKPRSDRFVGREAQLRQLRGFVDELSSRGAFEAIGRLATRGYRAAQRLFGVRDESVRFLVARGGLGKSALMAKFVLDHALGQERPFPFVYFDFDRPVLHAREPRQLLVEMIRQVALQFPRHEKQLGTLRQQIAAALASGTPDGVGDDPFDEFREFVRSKLTMNSRAFLLVLDTMEVVQYDPLALKGVVEFVSRLDGNVYGESFDELRIVAAGRADIPELRTSAELRDESHSIILKAFEVDEAAFMANRFGRFLLQEQWNDQWGEKIVGSRDAPPERREPLSIRVCVELVWSAERANRHAIVDEITAQGEEAGGHAFVAKLYQIRVLRHVQNEYAAKLAWPGLVVRHITRDIVRDKLAKICELEPQRVNAAFEALGCEVWMVRRVGEELWHREDLRSRTLPLMKRHNPTLFAQVTNAARDFYDARRDDPSAYGEWLYYRLLSGEDPEKVDDDWRDDVPAYLAGAADDFDQNSQQRAYLLGRTATKLLAPEQIQKLPPRLALDHLARTAEQLGRFDDIKVEPVLADVSIRIAKLGVTSSKPHPVRDIVLIKTGQWNCESGIDGASGAWAAHSDFARRFKRARMISDSGEAAAGLALGWSDESAPLRTLVQDLAFARLCKLPMAAGLDARLAAMLRGRITIEGHADLAALRLAAVFTREALGESARAWLIGAASVYWTVAQPTISLEELRALFQGGKEVRAIIKTELSKVLLNIGLKWKDLLKHMRYSLAQPFAIKHPDVDDLLKSSISFLSDQQRSVAQQSLRYFFASRDDDWIVPMGYAASRTRGKKDRDAALLNRFRSHNLPGTDAPIGGRGFPNDALQLLRNADEASDLLGVAHIFEEMGGTSAHDLRTLLTHHASWSERIQQMLDTGDAWTEPALISPPPRPGAVLHNDDCQKDRWGGIEKREGRVLEAVLGDVEEDDFDVTLSVRSIDDSPLEGPVIFHLHDTYPRQKIWIRKIRDSTRAVLEEVNAYGVYTVGAQVKTRNGLWTSLELDLATLPKLPRRFLDR